jgi:hypothetical protein
LVKSLKDEFIEKEVILDIWNVFKMREDENEMANENLIKTYRNEVGKLLYLTK